MSKLNITIALIVAVVVLVCGYFWYTPISHEKNCAELEQIFQEEYSQMNATSSMETTAEYSHHYSTSAGRCYIKVQRHDSMEGSYTTADKTILYDAVADKTAASCVTLLQRGVVINTECKQGDETITQEQFDEIEKSYLSD